MVTIIIVTILVTVILGVASYAAYWLRRGRRPVELEAVDTSPRYFYRYMPEDPMATPEVESAAGLSVAPAMDRVRSDRLVKAAAGSNGSSNGRSRR
jgi:hypothetical protein